MPPGAPRPRPRPLPPMQDHHWAGGMPSPTSPTLQVHEILRTSYTPFYYCLTRPPSTLIFKIGQVYTLSTLAETATIPATQRMYIEVPASHRVPVIVSNPKGITILDVLNTLYNVLRAPFIISVTDEAMIASSHGVVAQRRRSRSDDGVLENGFRRFEAHQQIQLLQGRTIFAGLEVVQYQAGVGFLRLRTTAAP